jgi:hypothetical protein
MMRIEKKSFRVLYLIFTKKMFDHLYLCLFAMMKFEKERDARLAMNSLLCFYY